MAHTNAPIAWYKVPRLVGLLGAPVALFWSLGFAIQQVLSRRMPALTGWSESRASMAVLAFVALGILAGVLLAWGRWGDFLRLPERIRAFWIGLTFFRSTLLAYFLAAPIVLLLSSLFTVGAPPVERQVLIALATFWIPLWWAPSLGALMTGWRLGRLYRRA